MKINVTQENLSKALTIATRVVGSRSTLPVLGNVYLKTDNNLLRISATNLEIGVTTRVGAKIEEEGDITIPAKLMNDYVAGLEPGNIQLETQKNSLSITTEHFSSKINGIEGSEFPSIPTVDNEVVFEINTELFKKALNQVVLVASSDDSRPVLTGVYLYTNEGVLYAVATDSYRLAEKKITDGIDKEFSIIVPSRSITEVLRIIDDTKDDNMSVLFDDNQICFRFENVELVSRIIDGQFPNYRQLIPEEVPTVAELNTKELQNITKITSLFARENAGSVTIKAGDNEFSMSSLASQVGENTSKVDAKVNGEPMEVSLNGRYITDALNVIGSDNITFGLTGKVNPVMIRPDNDDSYLHIVMPLRS